jgi:hypothetical protein
MLHGTHREEGCKEKDFGIHRLNIALDKYYNEVKDLESVISIMESENCTSKTAYEEMISCFNLQSKEVLRMFTLWDLLYIVPLSPGAKATTKIRLKYKYLRGCTVSSLKSLRLTKLRQAR